MLISCAGQAGLALGARLADMGISTLIVDKHGRLGDSWRSRYRSIKLNTPTYTDHYPFMRLPENWPRYLSQDQVAYFAEHYGQLMGLDFLPNTNVTSVKYHKSERTYRVEAQTQNGARTFSARHVVLATGVFSEEPNLPQFPGQDSFQGQLFHSSQHKSARLVDNVNQKNVVVIGPGTSGHDVAQDFVNAGVKSVTIVQRHPIFSISADASETFQLNFWNTKGISTDEADVIGNSFPLAIIRAFGVSLTQMISAHDKVMLDGLKKAGVALRVGDDGVGLSDYQLIRGGHFYIDQGANEMIIDGRIKFHRCEDGVKEVVPDGVVLADETKLNADIIVLATGFQPSKLNVEKIMGQDVAQRLDDFGQLNTESERNGVSCSLPQILRKELTRNPFQWWRNTGVPGFWYMTGSFMMCRQFSLPLAIQIAAVEKGLNKTYYQQQ